MKLKIVENIAIHQFITLVMEDMKPRLELITTTMIEKAEKWDWTSKTITNMPDADWYRYDVFTKQTALISVLDRIVYSHAFLQRFPSPRLYERKFEITQYIWIEYHFFQYMVNTVSLFDCLLILTNSVFRIGLKDRACKPETIIKNHWVWEVGFDTYLKKFDDLTKKYKEIRNVHLHRGKGKNVAQILNNDNLAFLGMVSFLQLHSDEYFPKDLIAEGYKVEVNDLVANVDSEVREIETQLIEILSFLEKVYLNKRPTLSL